MHKRSDPSQVVNTISSKSRILRPHTHVETPSNIVELFRVTLFLCVCVRAQKQLLRICRATIVLDFYARNFHVNRRKTTHGNCQPSREWATNQIKITTKNCVLAVYADSPRQSTICVQYICGTPGNRKWHKCMGRATLLVWLKDERGTSAVLFVKQCRSYN